MSTLKIVGLSIEAFLLAAYAFVMFTNVGQLIHGTKKPNFWERIGHKK